MQRKYDKWRIVCEKCGAEAPKKAEPHPEFTDAVYQNAEALKELELNGNGEARYDTATPCACGGRWCTTFDMPQKPGEPHAKQC